MQVFGYGICWWCVDVTPQPDNSLYSGKDVTRRERLEHAANVLAQAGIESAQAEATLMMEQLGVSRAVLLTERYHPLTRLQEEMLQGWLARRVRREPLQHILGVAYFYGLTLTVTPQVLIPRPETERLVEIALKTLRDVAQPRVLDVGTGSGAIALALKHERPDVAVTATDISAQALEVARHNARRLGLEVSFKQADLLVGLEPLAQQADMVLSNPPYLPETDRIHVSPEVQADPSAALYSGVDGLAHFRRLERQAHRLLKPGAILLVELDPRNSATVLAQRLGWREGGLEHDLVGRARFVRLVR